MINGFRGEYRFLSNFYIEPDGTNVEAEYQMEKSLDPNYRMRFNMLDPYSAKKLGKRVKLRPGWKDIKLDIMSALVLKKFEDHKVLKKLLLATSNQELVEDNNWGDTYWGKVNGIGENNLGKILMTTRELLKRCP